MAARSLEVRHSCNSRRRQEATNGELMASSSSFPFVAAFVVKRSITSKPTPPPLRRILFPRVPLLRVPLRVTAFVTARRTLNIMLDCSAIVFLEG